MWNRKLRNEKRHFKKNVEIKIERFINKNKQKK